MFSIKYFYLSLDRRLRNFSILLFILMIVGMLLENLGITLIVPFITTIIDPTFITRYPLIENYLNKINFLNLDYIILMSSLIFILFVFKNSFLFILSLIQSYFIKESHVYIAKRMFNIYINSPYKRHINTNSAIIIKNLTEEVFQFQYSLFQLLVLISETLILVSILILLLILEPIATIIIFGIIFIVAVIYFIAFKDIISGWGATRMIHAAKATTTIIESMTAIKEVKNYQTENFFSEKFAINNHINAKMNMYNSILQNFPRILLEMLGIIGIVAIIIYNHLFLNNVEILSSLILFAVAGFRILPSFNRILSSAQDVRYAYHVSRLIYNNFHNEDLEKIKNKKINKIIFKNQIIFEDINFKYQSINKFAIKNLNLTINKGDSIGVIGYTGSGKSTFIQILVGLLYPDSGSIKIDDKIVSNTLYNINNLSYVPQNILLLDDSIKNNIAFGINESDINIDKIYECIKSAGLEKFIKTLGDNINTNVGEKGVKLSGGQLQRIGIARALYKKPEIIIFDESTNALDEKTEKSVLDYIYNLNIDKTIIIISHRISSLKKCKKIIKFENGQIIDINQNE